MAYIIGRWIRAGGVATCILALMSTCTQETHAANGLGLWLFGGMVTAIVGHALCLARR